MTQFKTVKIQKGKIGWGGPLTLTPDDQKKYVISVTGGGIHPVAQKIADMTGAIAVDSFKNPVDKEDTLCAVIDCGGTARCGTYPRLRMPTINIKAMSPSGPLAKFMTEDIFVSGVTVGDVLSAEPGSEPTPAPSVPVQDSSSAPKTKEQAKAEVAASKAVSAEAQKVNPIMNVVDKIGRGAGHFMNVMYQAGRETIETVLKNILPFMAFVATLIGIINFTGIGDLLANVLTPLAGSVVGLVLLGLIGGIPFLSPLLAPGAVIGAVIGVLIGNEIANGTIPASYALPALFAINAQVGCDFAPVGLTLGEAKAETVSVGVPAILFSRLITGPLAVVIAYGFSFFL
jgi:PTS system glucitol/sorbitol-specific IIC component